MQYDEPQRLTLKKEGLGMRRRRGIGLGVGAAVLAALAHAAIAAPGGSEPLPLPAEPFFGHVTPADGLPDDTVRALLQDQVGFLWIGTGNGLARYDGTEMRVFRPVPGDSTSIGGRAVFALCEDGFGHLWVGTAGGGISRYDPLTGIFTNFSPAAGPGALPGRFVVGIATSPDSTVWAALQDGGLVRWDRRAARFERIASPRHVGSSTRADSSTAVLAARDGTIIVGFAGGGIGRYDPATRTWQLIVPHADRPAGPRPGLINHILQDHADRIWFATARGLAQWIPGSETLQWHEPATSAGEWENYLIRIAEDANGRLWIGAAVGLYLFDPASPSFRLFRNDPRRSGSVAPGPVMSVLCDRSGAIWTGGWQAGLSCLDPWRIRFNVLTHEAGDAGSLDQDAVVSVLEGDDGTLWVGTGGVTGVHEIGRLNRRRPGQAHFERVGLEAIAAPRTVLALCQDASGELWIGSDRGLLRLPRDAATARPADIPELDSAALAGASVYALELDHAGALWVGTFGRGLFRIDPARGSVTRYLHDAADARSLSQNRITRLHCDTGGRLWVGTNSAGLNLFDAETGAFRRFLAPEIGLSTITAFEDADAGSVYVATGAGLFIVHADSTAPALDRACGLADVAIAGLARDASGQLWIHTAQGLRRCNTESGEVQTYGAYYGVPSGDLYFGSYRGGSGQIYFGGKHGLIVVDPRTIRVNPYVPPVVITGLQVNDESAGAATPGAAGRVFPFVERVVLPYDRNDLRFTFAALQLAQPERLRFRYRLQHDDRAWRTSSTEGVANYTNLRSGKYVFEVQASTANGEWSPQAASVQIVIQPPWWRTTWARAAYLLLATALVALVYRLVVQRERIRAALEVERAEARHLHELDKVKSRFFANISHEFRTPLTLILGPLSRLQESAAGEPRQSLDLIERHARRLGELIEQLLDLSRLESGRLAIRWQYRDVIAWVQVLASSFSSLAADRRIKLVTEMPAEPLDAWFEPDLLEKILVNLLSNAFKFTPEDGEVRIAVEVGETVAAALPDGVQRGDRRGEVAARPIRIVVANTGSYIPPEEIERIFERFHQLPEGMAAGGTGIGLALTKELIVLLGGSITAESDREHGTRFTLILNAYTEAPGDAVAEATAAPRAPEPETAPAMPAAKADAKAPTSPVLATAGPASERRDGLKTARPRVLVVEDNDDLRAFLASELRDDYELLLAAAGDTGLATAIEEVPDLVLSDVIMPGLDGIELCRRLKSDERTDHIPVVLLSARTEVESRLAGLSSGADDYQAKPFDPRELRLRVRNLIEERSRLRERYARHVVQLGSAAMPVTSAEERFLKRAREIIDSHIDESAFGVEQLAEEIGMSKTQLLRKVRAVTGAAPRDLIRTHRLQRAAQLLAGGYGNVTEVAYAVGMESLSTFAKRFREQYGVPPSEYAEQRHGVEVTKSSGEHDDASSGTRRTRAQT
jgi:signal transduction histidine kinase/ligand-binding sensor domain-containing protein/DNA-binding response OmpR family regulator